MKPSLEIDQELHILRNCIKKLEFYVSQLEKKRAEVIRKYYFEEKTWSAIQKEMHIFSRTLSKYRDNGLKALSAMDQYMREVLKEPTQPQLRRFFVSIHSLYALFLQLGQEIFWQSISPISAKDHIRVFKSRLLHKAQRLLERCFVRTGLLLGS